MKRFLLTTIAILACGLSACQAPAPGDTAAADEASVAVDTAGVRAAIEAVTDSYETAERAGDEAAVAAFYADDAVIHPANKPAASGRAALDAYFAENDSAEQDVTFTTAHVGVAEGGDMAYELGTIAFPGGAGKYLTVYRLTADGWKIVADSWSNDAPATDDADGG